MFRFLREWDEFFERLSRSGLKPLEQLKQEGKVTEETEDNGHTITKRVRFESFDGSTTIEREESYPKEAEKYLRLNQLKRDRQLAISEERFEDAAKLRDEIKGLKDELGIKEEEKTKKQLPGKSPKRI